MWSLLYYEKSLDVFMNERFLQRMKAMLGAEYPDFEQALSLPSIKALRVNTLKIEKDQLTQIFPYPLQQNPLCNEGFILPQRDISYGNTPQHHAGLFYMQEPSASAAVSALKGRKARKAKKKAEKEAKKQETQIEVAEEVSVEEPKKELRLVSRRQANKTPNAPRFHMFKGGKR